jgi:hypothetical protein
MFTREGISANGAVLVPLPESPRLGIRHGWQLLHSPLLASRTDDNVILELNWRPALEVYAELVNPGLTTENFFDQAKSHPLGMFREGGEPLVRDPVGVREDGGLICLAQVPENASLAILQGSHSHLIGAAGEAADQALAPFQPLAPPGGLFLFDCVSRSLFLGPDFPQELDAVALQVLRRGFSCAVDGILTMGEIAAMDQGPLEFLNKTLVVCACHE